MRPAKNRSGTLVFLQPSAEIYTAPNQFLTGHHEHQMTARLREPRIINQNALVCGSRLRLLDFTNQRSHLNRSIRTPSELLLVSTVSKLLEPQAHRTKTNFLRDSLRVSLWVSFLAPKCRKK